MTIRNVFLHFVSILLALALLASYEPLTENLATLKPVDVMPVYYYGTDCGMAGAFSLFMT